MTSVRQDTQWSCLSPWSGLTYDLECLGAGTGRFEMWRCLKNKKSLIPIKG
ncbi:hypothetical protein HFA01_36030 [Halobacillus faecis]|uniref:Uncharacterized protein n=1 Tax=Halobacillus faecis TaxID=360184 RepID=A0A511WY91_9BACI|nr:hypothetical protein HFA01_36030 [Halobacillus faecis]